MASFAELNNNIVVRVLSVDNNVLLENGIEIEQKGIDFLNNLFNTNSIWKKTSYNTFKGKHYTETPDGRILSDDQGKSFRKNNAGIGYTYDEDRDAFIAPKQYDSWVLNEETCCYDPPIKWPTKITWLEEDTGEEFPYIIEWDEENIRWTSKKKILENTLYFWNTETLEWNLI